MLSTLIQSALKKDPKQRIRLDDMIVQLLMIQETELQKILTFPELAEVQDSKQQLYDITVSSIGALGPHGQQDSISNTRQSMRGEMISLQKHLESDTNPERNSNFDISLGLPSMISESRFQYTHSTAVPRSKERRQTPEFNQQDNKHLQIPEEKQLLVRGSKTQRCLVKSVKHRT